MDPAAGSAESSEKKMQRFVAYPACGLFQRD
jgi:hypothetical protein